MKVSTLVKIVAVVVVAVIATGIAVISSIDVNDYRGDITEQAKLATGRDLHIDGKMDLSIGFSPAITVDGVRFANAPWGSGADMVKLGHAAVEVSLLPLLTGDVQVKRLVLRDVDVLLETDAKGTGNWEFAGAADKTKQDTSGGGAGSIPWVGMVEVQNLHVTWHDGKTGQTTAFSLDRFSGRSDGPDDPLAFNLAGSLNGQVFSGKGTTGALAALGGGDPFPFDVGIDAAGASVTAKGTVRLAKTPEVQAEVSVSGDDLATVGKLAGAAVPGGKFRLAASLSGTADAVTVKGLQAALGDTNLAGDAAVNLKGDRPAIKAQLTSSLIDLDGLMPPKEKAQPQAETKDTGKDKAGEKRIFPADPLPVEGLRAVDADIKLNAGVVRFNKVDIRNLVVAMVLKDGTLTIKPMTAAIDGGTLNNRVTLVAKGDVLTLDADSAITKVDYGKILTDMQVTDEVAGTADGKIHLTGAGRSVRELMAGLDGSVEFVSGKGRIKNSYLAFASTDVLGSIAPLLKKKDASVMNCMVARFDIRKGQATSKGLILDTETMTISGKGGIDLGTEKLDLTFTPRPKETSLMNLAIPIVASGTLAEPRFAPEAAGAAKAAAGAALTFVNPLVALAPLVVGAFEGDQNPCIAALENKGKGDKTGGNAASAPKKEEGGFGGLIKGIGKSIDKTLGND